MSANKLLETLVPTIYSLIKSANDKLVPPGTIIAFHRATDLPQGWALCDGTNNTPDLRGRFIIATNPTGNATNASGISVRNHGDTGGEEDHTLTVGEMPSHNHGISDSIYTGSALDSVTHIAGNIGTGTEVIAGGVGATVLGNENGTHVHQLEARGGSGSHNNMPPFYALTYIMKIYNLEID